jgi:hypothetical protein
MVMIHMQARALIAYAASIPQRSQGFKGQSILAGDMTKILTGFTSILTMEPLISNSILDRTFGIGFKRFPFTADIAFSPPSILSKLGTIDFSHAVSISPGDPFVNTKGVA